MASGWLLQFLAVFTPWALGGEAAWAWGVMVVGGWVLGILLLAKWVVAWREEYQPVRWGDPERAPERGGEAGAVPREGAAVVLAVLQAVFLGLVAASLVHPLEGRTAGVWPGTADRGATLWAWMEYFGLFCVFWAARDWLLFRSARDRKEVEREKDGAPIDSGGAVLVPTRLRRLLWVLCLNGFLLAAAGFLQRAAGTSALWGLFSRGDGWAPEAVFGPWLDRGDAAGYFHLLWPVALGFWLWMQERAARMSTSALARFDGPQVVLLPAVMLMAVAPVIAGSGASAAVSLGLGLGAAVLVGWISRREISGKIRWITLVALALAGLAGLGGGWNGIRDRLVRPSHVLLTGLRVGAEPFTLLLRLRPGLERPAQWTPLVHLRDEVSSADPAEALSVGIAPDGGLVVQVTGRASGDVVRRTAEQFVQTYGQQEVLLAIVRDRDLRLFRDGGELGLVEGRAGDAPAWTASVGSTYLHVVSRQVGEVALVDAALNTADLAEAGRAGLGAVEGRLRSVRAYVPDTAALTNRLTPVRGAVSELRPDPQDRRRMWVRLSRNEGTGPLGFHHPLDGGGAGINGPAAVSFSVVNSRATPQFVRVSLDDGEPALAEIPPRTEKAITFRCRVPHSGPPKTLEVMLADNLAAGHAATVAPGADLVIRELRVESGAGFFRSLLDPDRKLGSLARASSGSPAVQLAAKGMAESRPWFGIGAGAFASAFPAFAPSGHPPADRAGSDWLEARATLGWAGVALLAAVLVVLTVRSWLGRGLPTLAVIVALVWLGLAGVLVSALLESPLRSPSVLFLTVVVAAMTTVIGVARAGR